MKKQNLVAIAVFLMLAVNLSSLNAASRTTSTPLNSMIDQAGLTQSPLLASDDGGTYQHNVDGVISQLQSGQNWELSTASSSTRRILVDLGVTAPFAGQRVAGRFITQCGTLGSLGVGQSADCATVFAFSATDSQASVKKYRIAFHPVNQPGTESIRYTCAAAVNNQCSVWSFEPANVDGRAIGRLIEVRPTSGKNTIDVTIGDFAIAFGGELSR